MPPLHAARIAPLSSSSIPAGWPETPSCRQDSNVGSHSMVKVVPVERTKDRASSRLSWVPTPMTVRVSALSRANCSTPGASRRQVDQWGAQNHSTKGRSDGAKAARLTVAPVATSTTSTEGRAEGAGSALCGAASAVGAAWAVGGASAGAAGALSGRSAPSPQAAAPRARARTAAGILSINPVGDCTRARTSGCSDPANGVQDPAWVEPAGSLADSAAEAIEDDDVGLAQDSELAPGNPR